MIVSLMLSFRCARFLRLAIERALVHVDHCIISTSKLPWSYDKEAKNYVNTDDIDSLISGLPASRITVIHGEWATEEDQRNEALERAKILGASHMIVQDPDEFYSYSSMRRNIRCLRNDTRFDHWFGTLRIHFGRPYLIVSDLLGNDLQEPYLFAIRCASGIKFTDRRRIQPSENYGRVSGICEHLSYVMTRDEMVSKITCFGHAHEIANRMQWVEQVFDHAKDGSRDVNPVNPGWWPLLAQRWPYDRQLQALLPSTGQDEIDRNWLSFAVKSFRKRPIVTANPTVAPAIKSVHIVHGGKAIAIRMTAMSSELIGIKLNGRILPSRHASTDPVVTAYLPRSFRCGWVRLVNRITGAQSQLKLARD